VTATRTATWDAGLHIIETQARTGDVFSANTIRDQLRQAGIEGNATGPLFASAIRDGLIRVVGYEQSAEASTRHRIAQYQAARVAVPAGNRAAVIVPVRRDTDGRFTTPQSYDTPLFPELPTS
jgi:hypothetical protein